MKKYHLVVIGGGSGGLTVAAGAAAMGANVALVEKQSNLGGDCLHYGCIPSKALIESAKQVYYAKKSSLEFGFDLQGEVDFSAVATRVKAAIEKIQKHDSAERFHKMGVDVYYGFGRLKGSHQVEISDGQVILGKRIVISTGSQPVIPDIEWINEVEYLTNETIFDLNQLPKTLIVIGAGPVGLELGQAFSRLGSGVTVIQHSPALMEKEDADMVPFVKAALEKEIQFLFNAKVRQVKKLHNGRKAVVVSQEQKEIQLEADGILVAAGRKPNTGNLGLDEAGVKTEKGYIIVNDRLQTTVPHIYAAGDVLRDFPFTHAAAMEGKIIVSNALLGLRRKVNYDHVPWVTFTDPEVFHLGLTEKQAKEKHGDGIRVHQVTLGEVDRFIADRNTVGLVKVITDAKGRILGAHAAGKNAGDWMQEIVFAKQHGHKIGDISTVIHPYPTHAAALQQTADLYWRRRLFEGTIGKILKKYIEWFR
ncbi:FAD-dependent oxidoreductase [Paenibacillus sp. GP183]|uniref:dihydrolipoyl dehydrogenase family protein n=1 Tax=Paenibacillus sp. GP183 TaxID=1882751 RepID=UPI0008946108|nr:FAD-dependent oxidoreductase [Paenibacillus sp. GP183]SED09376.1 Pyruvate/2-oxoglutarate dehydrogenase complex, dihydrolipoamide dehydrogenase (E3) component [Paenibacillus sp. GP183]